MAVVLTENVDRVDSEWLIGTPDEVWLQQQ